MSAETTYPFLPRYRNIMGGGSVTPSSLQDLYREREGEMDLRWGGGLWRHVENVVLLTLLYVEYNYELESPF